MYKKTSKGEGYVVSILQNNQTITEQGGKVTLPFGSEYEIRLRNKTRKRAVVDAYIDGEIAAKGIVVNANDSIDLERYVKNTGHALLKGARFKFVPLGDSRVEDKGEPENGILEVRWYPEKEPKPYTPPSVIEIHDHCHGGYHYCNCWRCHPPLFTLGHTGNTPDVFVSGGGAQSKGSSLGVNINNTSADISADNVTLTSGVESVSFSHDGSAANLCIDGGVANVLGAQLKANIAKVDEAGATVEGSESHQSFSTTYIDVDRNNPTILTLHLVGIHIPEPVEPEIRLIRECDDKPLPPKKGKLAAYCSTCGRKRRTDEKFCPSDGMRFQT